MAQETEAIASPEQALQSAVPVLSSANRAVSGDVMCRRMLRVRAVSRYAVAHATLSTTRNFRCLPVPYNLGSMRIIAATLA